MPAARKDPQGSGEPARGRDLIKKGATAEESVARFEPAARKRLFWATAAAEEKEQENWTARP
jgi:hypothetical protein